MRSREEEKGFYLLAIFNEHFTSDGQPYSTHNNTCLIHVANHKCSSSNMQ